MSEEIVYSTGTKHYTVRLSGQFTIRAKSEDEARETALTNIRKGDKHYCQSMYLDDFMLSPGVWERINNKQKGDK